MGGLWFWRMMVMLIYKIRWVLSTNDWLLGQWRIKSSRCSVNIHEFNSWACIFCYSTGNKLSSPTSFGERLIAYDTCPTAHPLNTPLPLHAHPTCTFGSSLNLSERCELSYIRGEISLTTAVYLIQGVPFSTL